MANGRQDQCGSAAAHLGFFLLGALVGAGVAFLMTPRSGQETRDLLREKASSLGYRATETVEEARHRAADYVDRGRDFFEEKTSQLSAAFEAGRQAMREEIAKLRHEDVQGEPEGV